MSNIKFKLGIYFVLLMTLSIPVMADTLFIPAENVTIYVDGVGVCSYLYCQSIVSVTNNNTGDYTFNASDLDAQIPDLRSYVLNYDHWYTQTGTYFNQIDNQTQNYTFTALDKRNTFQGNDITLGAGETQIFDLITVLMYPEANYKYNITFKNSVIDPVFNTSGTDFLNGIFTNTQLNSSNYVELNNSLTGSFESEVFDSLGSSNWEFITTDITGSGNGPDNQLDESVLFTKGINGTKLRQIHHFENTLNNTAGTDPITAVNKTGTPTFTAGFGALGTAYDVNGLNPINLTLNNSVPSMALSRYSINIWARHPTGAPSVGGSMIYHQGNAFASGPDARTLQIGLNAADGTPFLASDDGSNPTTAIVGPTGMNDSQWHMYTAVRNSAVNNWKFYIDGVLIGSDSSSSDITLTKEHYIGTGNLDVGSQRWPGQVDELMIFGDNNEGNLSQTTIQELFRRGQSSQNLTIRSCDDAACSGETYTDVADDRSLNISGTVPTNRYFQYKWDFESAAIPYSPELYSSNVTSVLTVFVPLLASITSVQNHEEANITWTSNFAGDTVVNYGTTTALGTTSSKSESVLNHNVTLTGLTSNTLYFYNVSTTNVNFSVTEGPFNFTTSLLPAPTISNVANVSITDVAATITWNTDVSANSTVNYGTTTSLGTLQSSASLVTSHSEGISGLTANTTYFYNVSSENEGGSDQSGPFSFTTLSAPPPPPPVGPGTLPIPGSAIAAIGAAFGLMAVAGLAIAASKIKK